MTNYNPKYETQVETFNISVVKGWVSKKNEKEIEQWLNEGRPHKRMFKDAIMICTQSSWLEGIKLFMAKDWMNDVSKLSTIIEYLHFIKKSDSEKVLSYLYDIISNDKKLKKSLSYLLFKKYLELKNDKKTAFLFSTNSVDFSHKKAKEDLNFLINYRYSSDSYELTRKELVGYLLEENISFEPYTIFNLVKSYKVSDLKEIENTIINKKYKIFDNKDEYFVFACTIGALLQNLYVVNKEEEEYIEHFKKVILKRLIKEGLPLSVEISKLEATKENCYHYALKFCYGQNLNLLQNTFGTMKYASLNLGLPYDKYVTLNNETKKDSVKVNVSDYWFKTNKENLKEKDREDLVNKMEEYIKSNEIY